MFREILLAPDRDRESGAWPVVSLSQAEDFDFRSEVNRRSIRRVELRRRGRDHGAWAVLHPEGLAPARVRPKRARAKLMERYFAARPIVFRGALPSSAGLDPCGSSAATLAEAGALRTWLSGRLPVGFETLPHAVELHDPERDLERILVGFEEKRIWVKTSRMSTDEGDRSLRLRISFGEEGSDDASRDESRHRAVAALGRALFPSVQGLEAECELRGTLEEFLGGAVLFTQHIGYWNAPEGGALFHHDAFDESVEGGQRGVLYVQLDGSTAWLALSIEDLALRVQEFAGWLAEEELVELAAELFTPTFSRDACLELSEDYPGLRRELALPGCGRLAPLVNRGPEFTGFLADAGHACVLEPGDAILLPNHGYARTAMHSVFCAGEETGLGLSLALRRRAE